MSNKRIPPLGAALAAGAAQFGTGAARSGPIRRTAAVLMGAASGSFLISSVREFRASDTTVNPITPESARSLVVAGPHRYSRNPMYVGMAGALVGHALWRGRVRALIPAAAFVLYIDREQIPAEETALREKFGPDYDAYTTRVRRWL